MILLRADGTPTYMLAVVVDDHDMDVTHVIEDGVRRPDSFMLPDGNVEEPAPLPPPRDAGAPALPPANGGLDYQLGGAYAPPSGVTAPSSHFHDGLSVHCFGSPRPA